MNATIKVKSIVHDYPGLIDEVAEHEELIAKIKQEIGLPNDDNLKEENKVPVFEQVTS